MTKSVKEKSVKVVRVPLIGGPSFGRSRGYSYDQHFDNAHFSKYNNPISNKEIYSVERRPSFQSKTVGTDILSDFIFSCGDSQGVTYTLWGDKTDNTIVRLYSSAGTNAATMIDDVDLGATPVTASTGSRITSGKLNASTNTVACLVHTFAGLYLNGSTLTIISDADFPASTAVGNFVYKDGYWFVMTANGNIHNSDLNDISAWTSTSFIGAANDSETGVTVARYKDKIVALRNKRIEFYELANPAPSVGSPLQRLDHLGINIGSNNYSTKGGRASVEAFDTIFWVGKTDTSPATIFTLENYQAVPITVPHIEKMFLAYGGISEINAGRMYNEPVLFVRTTTVEPSHSVWVYYLNYKLWTRWHITGIPTAHGFQMNYETGSDSGSSVGILKMYQGTSEHYISFSNVQGGTDANGYLPVLEIQTNEVDFDNDRLKRFHSCKIIGDTVTPNLQAGSTISVQWSDNDYVNFTTARTVSTDIPNKRLTNLGAGRRRAFKISTTSAALSLEALELEYSELDK